MTGVVIGRSIGPGAGTGAAPPEGASRLTIGARITRRGMRYNSAIVRSSSRRLMGLDRRVCRLPAGGLKRSRSSFALVIDMIVIIAVPRIAAAFSICTASSCRRPETSRMNSPASSSTASSSARERSRSSLAFMPHCISDWLSTCKVVGCALYTATGRAFTTSSQPSSSSRDSSSGATASGSSKKKSDPFPSSLTTLISPCISLISFLEIARPRPVPPYLRVVEVSAWLKAWNSCPIFSGAMPMPVSRTEKWSSVLSPWGVCRETCRTRIRISPFSVNLIALPTRLTRICLMRWKSPSTFRGSAESICTLSSMFFSAALWEKTSVVSLSSFSMSTGSLSMSIFADSSLEKSRMSLIT